MNSADILDKIAERAGWNAESKIALLCEYIDHHHIGQNLETFLLAHANEEESVTP
jgi:hypothetical protein